MSSRIADQLVAEEDEQQGREQQDLDWINYLKDKLVKFHAKVTTYGTHITTAKGIQKLSSEFEILVFGPARVGKSTLIQQISGDETIITSAHLNACTSTSAKYVDKYSIQWWDTPGKLLSISQLIIHSIYFNRFRKLVYPGSKRFFRTNFP
jgi:ribosome biogenesis GTPase A